MSISIPGSGKYREHMGGHMGGSGIRPVSPRCDLDEWRQKRGLGTPTGRGGWGLVPFEMLFGFGQGSHTLRDIDRDRLQDHLAAALELRAEDGGISDDADPDGAHAEVRGTLTARQVGTGDHQVHEVVMPGFEPCELFRLRHLGQDFTTGSSRRLSRI